MISRSAPLHMRVCMSEHESTGAACRRFADTCKSALQQASRLSQPLRLRGRGCGKAAPQCHLLAPYARYHKLPDTDPRVLAPCGTALSDPSRIRVLLMASHAFYSFFSALQHGIKANITKPGGAL